MIKIKSGDKVQYKESVGVFTGFFFINKASKITCMVDLANDGAIWVEQDELEIIK